MGTLQQVSSTEVCKQERGMLEGQNKGKSSLCLGDKGLGSDLHIKTGTKCITKKKIQTENQPFQLTCIAGLPQKRWVKEEDGAEHILGNKSVISSIITLKVGGCRRQP